MTFFVNINFRCGLVLYGDYRVKEEKGKERPKEKAVRFGKGQQREIKKFI